MSTTSFNPTPRVARVGRVFDLRQPANFVRMGRADHRSFVYAAAIAGGSAMTIDIEPLRQSLGTKIEDEDVVTQAPLKAMIATFDRSEKAPEEGEPIAPGWHLCFLHSYARPAQLGRDGAPSPAACCPRSRCRAACMPARPSPSRATSGSATG
jgi:hypothetical protein